MKPTFLDHLSEVSVGDLIKLRKGDIPNAEIVDELLPKEINSWLFNQGYYLVDRHNFHEDSYEYKELGEGSKASVFVKDDNDKFVLKIARKPDPCWLKFIKEARGSRNPHFPRVVSLKEWKIDREVEIYSHKKGGTYFFAMIERLWPLRLPEIYESFEEKHVPMLAAIASEGWMDAWLHEKITIAAGRQMLRDDIRDQGRKFLKSNHPFAKAFQTAEKTGCHIDLHTWNVMMREPEGTMVITDPVSYPL